MTMNDIESFFGTDNTISENLTEPIIVYPKPFSDLKQPCDLVKDFFLDFDRNLAVFVARFSNLNDLKLDCKMYNDGRQRLTIALTPDVRSFLNSKAKSLFNKLQSTNGNTSLVSCIQGKYTETAFMYIANGLFSFCGLNKRLITDHNIYNGNSGDLEDFRIGDQIIDIKHRNEKINKGYMDSVDFSLGKNRNIIFFTGDDKYKYNDFININNQSYKCILGGMFDDSLWVDAIVKKKIKFGNQLSDRKVLDPNKMYDLKKTLMFLLYHAMLEENLV